MDNKTLKLIEGQIGYAFKNSDLLQQAFIRRSYSKENGGADNEVLEFIGDKALDFVIVKLLAERFGSYAEEYEDYNRNEDCNEFLSELNEGKLTELKKRLVCREMLAKRIRMFGFQYELIMGEGDCEQNINEKDSVQEDLFEAIIGAVALDSNWNIEKITEVIDNLLEPDFYFKNGFNDEENYVSLLQQWYQKKYNQIPVYVYNYIGGWFYSGEYVNYKCYLGTPLGIGFEAGGKTKAEARMKVAKKAYEYIKKEGLLFTLVDEVGEPDFDRAINQLQELYQKGYIGKPYYDFSESYDEDGNPIWHCECHLEGEECYYEDDFSSKKEGKKSVAYDMLCYVLGWEEEDEA